ncbi:hypothetical protein EJB05_15710, partial [Eragrostis curvula]
MMAAVKVYVPLFTALFFSGLMQLSMAQDKPVTATARVVDAKAIDQAIAYLLISQVAQTIHLSAPKTTPASLSTMAVAKVYVLLFISFFSGFIQMSMAQDKPTAMARAIDAKAIDQAIAYLLMFAALFVTYFVN